MSVNGSQNVHYRQRVRGGNGSNPSTEEYVTDEEHHFIGLFFPFGIEEIFCTNSRGNSTGLWSCSGGYFAVLKERLARNKKLRFNLLGSKKKWKYYWTGGIIVMWFSGLKMSRTSWYLPESRAPGHLEGELISISPQDDTQSSLKEAGKLYLGMFKISIERDPINFWWHFFTL